MIIITCIYNFPKRKDAMLRNAEFVFTVHCFFPWWSCNNYFIHIETYVYFQQNPYITPRPFGASPLNSTFGWSRNGTNSRPSYNNTHFNSGGYVSKINQINLSDHPPFRYIYLYITYFLFFLYRNPLHLDGRETTVAIDLLTIRITIMEVM